MRLQRRIKLEHIASVIATQLSCSSCADVDASIDRALSRVGRFLNVDRVYVFRFIHDDYVCNNTHEWCAKDVEPQIDLLQNVDIKIAAPLFYKYISVGERYCVADVDSLCDGSPDKAILEVQSIKSIAIQPLVTGHETIGFWGLDAVLEKRSWSSEELAMLDLVGQSISFAIKRAHFERELMEAKNNAEIANRAKSIFLANMSHELNTPLNGVLGMIQLLETSELSKEQQVYVSMARMTLDRLSSLVVDVLEMSRSAEGINAVKDEEFDVYVVAKEYVALYSAKSFSKDVIFNLDCDVNVPCLYGDVGKLRQILSHVVGNAFKFTSCGEVCLSISCIKSDSEQSILLFIVSDTGIGMSDDALSMISSPFYQYDQSLSKNYQGAGLGVAVCRRLLSLLGGNMAFESSEGSGASVYISVPFRHAEHEGIRKER